MESTYIPRSRDSQDPEIPQIPRFPNPKIFKPEIPKSRDSQIPRFQAVSRSFLSYRVCAEYKASFNIPRCHFMTNESEHAPGAQKAYPQKPRGLTFVDDCAGARREGSPKHQQERDTNQLHSGGTDRVTDKNEVKGGEDEAGGPSSRRIGVEGRGRPWSAALGGRATGCDRRERHGKYALMSARSPLQR